MLSSSPPSCRTDILMSNPEIAVDLITASLADAYGMIANGGTVPDDGLSTLADQIVAALSPDDLRDALAQFTAIATLLLIGLSNHRGVPPEVVLLEMRRTLATG